MNLPELETKLSNCGLNDNNSSSSLKDESGEKTEMLKICFNGGDVIEVDRKKLLQKSLYFQAITNSSFNDHKKDIVEVNFDASFQTFQQVINYVETGDIKRKNDYVLEIFELSTYLQIECIIKKFKDTFVYNLNTRTLSDQLNRIKNNPLLKDFEEVALKFEKSGKPSVSGLYILEKLKNGRVFMRLKSPINEEIGCKLFPEHFEGVYRKQINVMKPAVTPLVIVGRFHNSLIISDSSSYLYQYNLITGITVDLEVLGMQKVCWNDEKVFAVGLVGHYNGFKLKVSVLSSDNCDEQLKVTKTKVFESIKVAGLLGVFCCNEKVYIMYTFNKHPCRPNVMLGKELFNVNLLVLCAKTLAFLKRFRVKDILYVEQKIKKFLISQHSDGFTTIYHDKESSKVFIYIGIVAPILAFDTQKENFCFVESTLVTLVKNAIYKKSLPDYVFTDYNHNKVYKVTESLIPYSSGKDYMVSDYEYTNGKFIYSGYGLPLDRTNDSRDYLNFFIV